MEFILPPYQPGEAEGLGGIGLTMRGKIRTKEKCRKCGKAFKQTLQGLICPDCLTRPEKYFIDILGKKKLGEKRLKIYSDKSGTPLDSYEWACRVLEHIRYEIDNHIFDHSKYVKQECEKFFFFTRVEIWLKNKESCKEEDSLAGSYTRVLNGYKNKYFLKKFKNSDVRDIRTTDIKAFLLWLPTHLSPKTKFNILMALQNFFNELVEDQVIDHPPAFKKILKQIKKAALRQKRIQWFDLLEQREVLNFIGQISHHRPIIEFMCETGLRPGEGMALYRDDYDKKEDVLHVHRTFADRKLKNIPKGGRETDEIPLSDKAIKIVKALPIAIRLPFMFINPDTGSHYTLDVLDGIWVKVRDHFIIDKKVKLYNFIRHSFATQIARCGGTPYEIKELLRHTDIRTTQKYVQKDMEPLRARLKKRAEMINFSDEGEKRDFSKMP